MGVEVYTMPKTFGQLVASLRESRGLSAYALAQRAGVSDQAVHTIEHTDRSPSFETARRLAAALGVGLDKLSEQMGPVDLPEPTPGRPRGRPPKTDGQVVQPAKRPRGRPRKQND